MVDDPPPASRFFVLAISVVLLASAGVLHLAAGPDYLWGTAILGTIGAVYLALFLFASTRVCYNAAMCLSLGLPWWE